MTAPTTSPSFVSRCKAALARAIDILWRPRPTWEQIATEGGSARELFTSYLAPVAAAPALATFIGYGVVGAQGVTSAGAAVTVRMPLAPGLVSMVIGWLLSLVLVWVMARIAAWMAPSFGGRRDAFGALKLVGYGATAGWAGGLFSIVPALAPMGVLAALYSVYLIYLGAPSQLGVPPERRLGFTGVLLLCGVALVFVVGSFAAALTPRAA